MQGFFQPNAFMNMNVPNNMNNFNNFAFQNPNQMMNQSLMVGNWFNMYTSNQPNFEKQNINNGKITVVFKTGRGLITTIFIDYGKTISYLIQVYFKRVGKPELFLKPLEIGFIYNARVIDFNDSRLVEDFFKGINYATITVNDIGDLIGA